MFDPTYPPANAELLSAPMRNQFNALKALIDAIQTLTAAQVDGVTTLPPGDPAAASVTVIGTTLHFTFQLPQGAAGTQGPPGEVTQSALDAAVFSLGEQISQCALDPISVGPLFPTVSDPPTQAEVQSIADRLDELIGAIKRV
jgi:hypothetical protein